MKDMNFPTIHELVKRSFFEMYKTLDTNLKNESGKIRLRNEQNEYENTVQYLIEVINLKKVNEDDYGLVGCVNIDHFSNELMIRFEILQSDGPIISIKNYKLPLVDCELYNALDLNNALLYMKSLPTVLYSTYMSIQ